MPAHMHTHITPILTYTLIHWHVLPSKSTRAYHTHNDMIHNRTLAHSSVDIHTRISRAPSHEMHSYTGTHSRRRAHAVATCKAQRRTSTVKKNHIRGRQIGVTQRQCHCHSGARAPAAKGGGRCAAARPRASDCVRALRLASLSHHRLEAASTSTV